MSIAIFAIPVFAIGHRAHLPEANLRPLLVIGFLGGHTTFSRYEWESHAAIRDGGFWMGLTNLVRQRRARVCRRMAGIDAGKEVARALRMQVGPIEITTRAAAPSSVSQPERPLRGTGKAHRADSPGS